MHESDLGHGMSLLSKRSLKVLAALVTLCLVAGVALRFGATSIWDDAYFFTRYADNYRASGDYSWNHGEPPSYGLTSVAYGAWVYVLRLLGGEATLSLWIGSAFWGGVALALVYLLARWQAVGELGLRLSMGTLFWGILALNAANIAVHICSGMDTTLAMAWLAGYLYLWKRFEGNLSPSKAMILGLLGGMAWYIRPDLLLFPIMLPLGQVLLAIKPVQKQMAGYILLFTLFMVLLLMGGGVQYLGGLFPLAFYVKSLNLAGEGISRAYYLEGLRHLGLFMLWNLPTLVLVPWAHLKARKQRQYAFSRPDMVLLACLLLFLAYQTFVVIPIMGYHQRFLYPVWPVMVYFALRSWLAMERLGGVKLRLSPAVGGASIAVLGLFMLATNWFQRPQNALRSLGHLDVATAYRELGRNNWPYLQEFVYLGDSLRMASTELGILGAMAPRNVIDDLSGLHDLETARYGLNTDRLLREHQPDLIYMPHPDYVELIAALHSDSTFQRHYVEFPADSIHAWLGIALRKESPFFVQMEHIVLRGKNVEEKN